MKNRRHILILDIIDNNHIHTQDELAQELLNRGLKVTQATISRDIKDLRLKKIPGDHELPYYIVPNDATQDLNERQIRIFSDSVLSIASNGSLIVIKTISGSAAAAAETIDSFKWEEILGCVAGDNTILVAASADADTDELVRRFQGFLR